MSRTEAMLQREQVANRPKHWVRLVTACNSRCSFCLDTDTPRNLFLEDEDIRAELRRGVEELGADKVILSGGEASLHPKYFEFIRYARELGYDRVQTVTNGYLLGRSDFYERAVRAGLGEITYSLHGHTEELHDELTGTPGAFKRIVRAIARTVRDPRVICNVDVVICKPNVGVLDKVVELAIRLGVTEFDLLHVIPQAAAYDNRDELFYDPAEHIETLHKVFRLNRHPRFVIWTNRFPVSFLEGLEDLIQDPHKMLDEVNGRRFMVRRYLDFGRPLDCRQPERCVHCFIEPFCTTMDRMVQRQNDAAFDVWWADDGAVPQELPFGVTRLGLEATDLAALPPTPHPVLARVDADDDVPADRDLHLVAHTEAQLDAWVGRVPLRIELNRATAPWMLAHRDRLTEHLASVTVHQPGWEHMSDSLAHDVDDPAAFFLKLDLPELRVSGLPPCAAPNTTLLPDPAELRASLFESGRLSIRELARHHVQRGYRGKSLRCRTCRVTERCDGLPINLVRAQGLRRCRPLVDGPWAEAAERQLAALHPDGLLRVGDGAPPLAAATSLAGFDAPQGEVLDPLAVAARDKQRKRAARRAALTVLNSPGGA